MMHFGGSGGGSYANGQYTFLDRQTIKIVPDDATDPVPKGIYSKDDLMALQDPREILVETHASADTSVYRISESGKFESAEGDATRS